MIFDWNAALFCWLLVATLVMFLLSVILYLSGADRLSLVCLCLVVLFAGMCAGFGGF